MTTDDKCPEQVNVQLNSVKIVKGRKLPYKKTGNYKTFYKLYGCVIKDDGTVLFDLEELPPTIDPNLVWSVVEGDDYNWYLSPGFRFVNRTGHYLIAENARGDGHHNDYLF